MMYITTYPLTQRINPMRKLLLTTAAVAAAIGVAGCSKKPAQESTLATQTAAELDSAIQAAAEIDSAETDSVTGTLTDRRDGKKYRTAVIGGKRWMAENLNYHTERSGCYKKVDSNCDKYGRLYAWDAAMTACPAGYHLASDKARYVVKSIDTSRVWEGTGKKLKAKSGWIDFCRVDGHESCKSGNGTDEYGFSALPGGCTHFNCKIGEDGFWWTSSPGRYRIIFNRSDYFYDGDNSELGYSVRCVADTP
jgi:uncharacterized protein (TIGR02145 family)